MTFADNLLTEENRKELVRKLQVLDKPLLLLHGTGDKCVDVRCSKEFISGVRSSDKTLVEYDNKCHVLLSEEEETKNKFLGDMADFITKKKEEYNEF